VAFEAATVLAGVGAAPKRQLTRGGGGSVGGEGAGRAAVAAAVSAAATATAPTAMDKEQ